MEKTYDVIVIGGGVAGCSAALAAKRRGMSVLLLEKLTVLGGLATAGHIVIYLPLDDGYGRQVIGGISEELLKLSARYAYFARDFSRWKENGKRYECKYNGPAFSLALEELLLGEGVEILYDTLFAGAEIQDGVVTAVYTENKSGRSKIACRAVADASGDADLFARAGEPVEAAPNNLAIWNYCVSAPERKPDYKGEDGPAEAGRGHEHDFVQRRGGADAPGLHLVSIGKIDTKKAAQTYEDPYYGDTGEGVNRFIIDGHKRLLGAMKEDPSLIPASLPGIAQIRTSRRIKGAYELGDADANRHFEDNIGGTGDWRKPGPVYEIPYRTLYTENVKNVLSAGRCISTRGEAWEIIRCIPQASLTGQAAGTALSMALKAGLPVQALDVNELRNQLKEDGVILDVNA